MRAGQTVGEPLTTSSETSLNSAGEPAWTSTEWLPQEQCVGKSDTTERTDDETRWKH
jgi:hypothetical protein